MTHVTWRCECGLVEAKVPAAGNRLTCYCESCRAFVTKLGCADRLDAQGGNDLLQALPRDVTIPKGADHLAYTRLTDKGPSRWFTTCCNTPMANTLPTRTLPFASFQVHDIEQKEALRPQIGAVHPGAATGPVRGAIHPRRTALRFAASILGGAVKTYATGTAKQNPFFDPDTGAPIGPRQDIG